MHLDDLGMKRIVWKNTPEHSLDIYLQIWNSWTFFQSC